MSKHDERCPACGKFVEQDADGFYDRLEREDDASEVRAFCAEACADEYHRQRAAHLRHAKRLGMKKPPAPSKTPRAGGRDEPRLSADSTIPPTRLMR